MDNASERKRYTRQERAELLERFDASGLSAMRFAREHGLKYPTLAYWLKARGESSRPQSFVELAVREPAGSSAGIEIFLPGGAALRAPDASSAARLIRELGLAC